MANNDEATRAYNEFLGGTAPASAGTNRAAGTAGTGVSPYPSPYGFGYGYPGYSGFPGYPGYAGYGGAWPNYYYPNNPFAPGAPAVTTATAQSTALVPVLSAAATTPTASSATPGAQVLYTLQLQPEVAGGSSTATIVEKNGLPIYTNGWQYVEPDSQTTAMVPSAKIPDPPPARPPWPRVPDPPPARPPYPPPPGMSTRVMSGDVVRGREREHWRYYEYDYPPPGRRYRDSSPPPEPGPPPTGSTPVLLCHTCSVCGQMRSAGFHRSHPVVPGKPIIEGVCRRCKKKGYSASYSRRHEDESVTKVTRVRRCIADEPCDWPDRDDNDGYYRSGRGRSKHRGYEWEEVFVDEGRGKSRVHTDVKSKPTVGLGILPQVLKDVKRVIRIASESPPRRSYTVEERTNIRRREGSVVRSPTGPPPFVARMEEEQLPPPPMRRRARSISPVPYRGREEYYVREGAVERVNSNPGAYRSPSPPSPHRGILKTSGLDRETSYHQRIHAPRGGGIESTTVEIGGPKVTFVHRSVRSPDLPQRDLPDLGPSEGNREREFKHRYRDMDDRYPRASYLDYHRDRRLPPGEPYVEELPSPMPSSLSPPPPTREFERLRVRYVSPRRRSRSRSREPERLPLDYRHVSATPRMDSAPPLPPLGAPMPDERVRNRERGREERRASDRERIDIDYRPSVSHPRRGRSPLRQSHSSTDSEADGGRDRVRSGYRTVLGRTPSPPLLPRPRPRRDISPHEFSPPGVPGSSRGRIVPLPLRRRGDGERERDWEELTASGSEGERRRDAGGKEEVVEVRTWRGHDEDGKPVRWVEERRVAT